MHLSLSLYDKSWTVTPRIPKYKETESRQASTTYIREENTPRIHAKLKVTWANYKIIMKNQHYYNMAYKSLHMIADE